MFSAELQATRQSKVACLVSAEKKAFSMTADSIEAKLDIWLVVIHMLCIAGRRCLIEPYLIALMTIIIVHRLRNAAWGPICSSLSYTLVRVLTAARIGIKAQNDILIHYTSLCDETLICAAAVNIGFVHCETRQSSTVAIMRILAFGVAHAMPIYIVPRRSARLQSWPSSLGLRSGSGPASSKACMARSARNDSWIDSWLIIAATCQHTNVA